MADSGGVRIGEVGGDCSSSLESESMSWALTRFSSLQMIKKMSYENDERKIRTYTRARRELCAAEIVKVDLCFLAAFLSFRLLQITFMARISGVLSSHKCAYLGSETSGW